MNLALLVFLPLVGGYAFSTIWAPSLYRAARESGHRLYFRAIFYGCFLVAVGTELHLILYDIDFYQQGVIFVSRMMGVDDYSNKLWNTSCKIMILINSFVLGPVLGHLLNITKYPWIKNFKLSRWWQKKLVFFAIQNNDFELLIARSVYRSIPLLLTLPSNKVYLGWAVRAPNPVEKRTAIRILPLMSGYRDGKNQKLIFTTDYLDVLTKLSNDNYQLDHLDIDDFEVVLPYEQICSAHLFDIEAYEHFKDEEAKEKEINKEKTR